MAVTDRQLSSFEAAIARHISAGTILAGYDICFRVEDVVDIKLWQTLLNPCTKGKKVRFFPFVRHGSKRITGKSYIMSHRSEANPHYILCVDSDLDYMLGREGFDAEHYILQTYAYSWESHHCWHEALQAVWLPWQRHIKFDFSEFVLALSHALFDAIVLLLTKKRLGHRGLTLDSLCNALDRIQPNQMVALSNNGKGIINAIEENLRMALESVRQETDDEIQATISSLSDKGINRDTIYLYMQVHSIYNLVGKIGKALMAKSFEQQVLLPSFSIGNEYEELRRIKRDIAAIVGEKLSCGEVANCTKTEDYASFAT